MYSVVAEVDCTGEGKTICSRIGVSSFPTLKWGEPNNLEDYKGGRDYAAFAEFAKKNLKKVCSPSDPALCDAKTKAEIERLQSLSAEELQVKINEQLNDLEKAQEYLTQYETRGKETFLNVIK